MPTLTPFDNSAELVHFAHLSALQTHDTALLCTLFSVNFITQTYVHNLSPLHGITY